MLAVSNTHHCDDDSVSHLIDTSIFPPHSLVLGDADIMRHVKEPSMNMTANSAVKDFCMLEGTQDTKSQEKRRQILNMWILMARILY